MESIAEKIIKILDLKPLPMEGGYFRETYRSLETLDETRLPDRYKSDRAFSTAIYYLLTPETFSSLHALPTDEVFHFYLGDPVEMLQLAKNGSGRLIKIGNNIEDGAFPQVVVPKFTWQGTKLISGGQFALLGTTMAPGFEFKDYIAPDTSELLQKYPDFSESIKKLL